MGLQLAIAVGVLVTTGVTLLITNHIRNRLDTDISHELRKLKQILEELDEYTKRKR